jgi:REP element-mobilizing transposase RayT
MAQSDEEIPFSFRVPERLKQAFKTVCKRRDRSMSQELRDFMRSYVAKHADERQYEIQGVKDKI